MTIRQELEIRLATFAASQSPKIEIAYEGVPFTKPTNKPFLECFLISAGISTVTVDAIRNRERGTFQVNVWYPSGSGARAVEMIGQGLLNAFPVVPKVGTVSIEQPANTGRLIVDLAGWIVLPVTIIYRQET